MMLIRPVAAADHNEILGLAKEAGIGMTSLPPDPAVLENKIVRSVESFNGSLDPEQENRFLFVLEDTGKKALVGTTGIVTHVGLRRPFYSYKLSTIVQASPGVKVYSPHHVLHMVNDYTGATEIGSLFLLPSHRRDGIGKFLSRSRFLMLAEFPDIFSDVVISEIRGVQDADGHSPFYKNLAQHFFQMDFRRADFIYATQGGQFISDLMPRYPVYVNLLDARAQAVIGQPLEASKPAKAMLEQEGFHYQGYIDIFDAGPTLQADLPSIRTVQKSRKAKVAAIKDVPGTGFIVSNTAVGTFRMALTGLAEGDGGVTISPQTAEALGVKKGDAVRYVEA